MRCFEKYGPGRTSMSDIAEEAGISRRTLYRVFDDRTTLVEAILHRRLVDLGHTVRARLETYADVEEALVDGSLFSIEVAEGDMINVPRGTHHWFDLCKDRRIRAIRLFQDPAGWTPNYTGSGEDAKYQPLCFGPGYLPPERVTQRL